MSEHAMRVDGLRVTVGSTQLVRDVSVSACAGELVAIVGETGAGKTMTMKAIAGLLPPRVRAQGTMTLAGSAPFALGDARVLRSHQGRSIGFVLQNPAGAFDPLLRLEAQLGEGVRAHGLMTRAAARERALELLGALGFRDAEAVLRLFPHQLSGGMSQRAAIAMAMMPAPAVLIADEPTSALDANVRVEVLTLLRRLAADAGSAVLLVTHDLALASQFCDSVCVLYAGRVVERGPIGAVLAGPQHPYSRQLLACAPSMDTARRRELPVIRGSMPQPGAWPPACPFEPRCPQAAPVCREQDPPLRGPGGHRAACHFAFARREEELECLRS